MNSEGGESNDSSSPKDGDNNSRGLPGHDHIPNRGARDVGGSPGPAHSIVEAASSEPGQGEGSSDLSRAGTEEVSQEPVDTVLLEAADGQHIESLMLSMASSGPIPSAPDLALYPPEMQERILRMAESNTTDESKRRSQIVNAQVKVAFRSQWIQLGVTVLSISCAAGVFLTTGSPWAAAFLSGPIIQALGVPLQSFAASRGAQRASSQEVAEADS